ncbi:hypothetical protein ABI59_12230 [Acidobacteria bacterium Mor1]|nr:hypothetical protein ABI59_12230 [Acidobacteria bacterium Mor1]
MSKPLVFISHKHSDTDIGGAIARFVRNISGGNVDVHLSSDPNYEGPRVGKKINDELRTALSRTGLVILIYTSRIDQNGEYKDWDYCMWECGLAEEPNSARTEVLVLQCLPDKPIVFQGKLQVLAWERDSVISFARRFREPDFYPAYEVMDEKTGESKTIAPGPLTGLSEREIDERAEELLRELREAIKEPGAREGWSAWTHLQLEIPEADLDGVRNDEEGRQKIREKVKVVDHSPGFPGLFARAAVNKPSHFEKLIGEWEAAYPGRSLDWWETIVQQMLDSMGKRDPQIPCWSRFREINGDDEFIPLVSWVSRLNGELTFDFCFMRHSRVNSVGTRMTRTDRMFYYDLDKKRPDELLLKDLLQELDDRSWTRIPLLKGGRAVYIIHASMIDRFMTRQALGGQDVSKLTLQDILDVQEMREMFENTFATVSEEETLEDARKRMAETERAEDVFVTEDGTPEGKVRGWLTDREIVEGLDPGVVP